MFRSSLIVTFLTLSASALGFFVQLLIAQRFGLGVEVDSYLFSLSFPTFLSGLVSAILSFNLIPRLILVKKESEFYYEIICTLVIGFAGLSILLTILMYGAMLLFIEKILPVNSPILKYDELHILIIISCSVGGVQVLQGCIASILNAEKKYVHSAVIALLPYAGMLGLMHEMNKSTGIKPAAVGLLIGGISAAMVGIFLLKKYFKHFHWKKINLSELRNLANTSSYTALAISCFSAYSIVDSFWGPRAGDGTLAALGYAQRLVIAIGNLAVAGPSALLVPHFAEYLHNNNHRGFIALMRRAFLLVGAIAAVTAIFLSLFSVEIVKLLFGRGEFGTDQISEVAQTIRNMTPGMIAMLLSVIGLRILFCFKKTHKVTAGIGVGWAIGYFLGSFLAHKYGAPGIALAYSSTWIITLCVIVNLINKQTRKFNA